MATTPPPSEDQDQLVHQWVKWIKGIVGEAVWKDRCREVREFVKRKANKTSYEEMMESHVPTDLAAWHMYLCDAYLNNLMEYDFFQGSRVIPVVLALARDGFPVTSIPGAEERVRHAVMHQPAMFETTVFELLVASAYARNGWSEVKFLAETRTGPQPDLSARSPRGEILIECKRKSRVSAYAEAERAQWLRMYRPIRQFLLQRRLPVLLDVTFHIPLIALEEDYLSSRLGPHMNRRSSGVIIDDDDLCARVRPLDLKRLQNHLKTNTVRFDSALFHHLLYGYIEPWRSFSHMVSARFQPDAPRFVDTVDWAAGALWSCDAPGSVNAKARHMMRDLAGALRQFPEGTPAAVHWGIDIYDGEHMSREILKKTLEGLSGFDPMGKDLRWVYCHLFEPRVLPDVNWDFAETCHFIGTPVSEEYLLSNPLLVTPP